MTDTPTPEAKAVRVAGVTLYIYPHRLWCRVALPGWLMIGAAILWMFVS